MVSVLAAHTPDFQGGAKPFPEKYGYKLDEGNTFIDDVEPEDAQLIILGHDGDTLVGVLKVDREDYFDADAGEEKYRNQPGTERRMGFIAEYLTAIGNSITDVEVVTSNAYASRVPQAIAAGLQYDGGRQFGVAMYGRATMAEVRGEEMQPGVPLNQLPGDLRVYYDGVQRVMELSS